MKTKIKVRKYVKIFTLVLGAIVLGLIVAGISWILKWQKVNENGSEINNSVFPDDVITYDNLEYSNGKYYVNAESKITINVQDKYINKFKYYYVTDQTLAVDINITYKNIYEKDDTEYITDRCRSSLKASVVNIGEEVSKIELTFSGDAIIYDMQIYNVISFNWFSVLYYSVFAGMILFLIFGAKIICNKIENAFAIIALSIGIMFVILQPPGLISWDEHIHFFNSNAILDIGESEWKEARDYIYDNPEEFPYVSLLSIEERNEQIENLNAMDGTQGKYPDAKFDTIISGVGYVHMAVAFKLLHALNVPFFTAFVITKMVNLFVYVILVWCAIRILPTHKLLMTVVGLMPTPIYMACAYSYDPLVIGCVFLATAIILREYYEPLTKISWKRILFLCIVMIIGCCPKAVYIPLILSIIALPSSKFESKKQHVMFIITIVVVFLAMMSTFVLPALISSDQAGDLRGGDTSVSEQLALIFSHLFAYIRVFFENFWNTIGDYMFGRESLAHLAYSGYLRFSALTGILMMVVAFTDTKGTCPREGKTALTKYKIASLVCVAITIGLIWTALYLSFTEVGETTIAGVQGRYYIPFLFLVMYVIGDVQIENKIPLRVYRSIVLGISIFMLFQMIYQPIYLQYCQ